MNSLRVPREDERLLDLLVQRATEGLSSEEEQELNTRRCDSEPFDELCFDYVTACLDQAWAGEDATEAMPRGLRDRLEDAASRFCHADENGAANRMDVQTEQQDRSGGTVRKLVIVAAGGWLIAAAALGLAAVAWVQAALTAPPVPENRQVGPTSIEEERQFMIDRHEDMILANWQEWDGPEIDGVTGDVAWSPSEQAGFLRFEGLPVNDPNEWVYQIWLVDAARGEPLEVPPVDGGVFSVEQQRIRNGEIVIPIQPKLPLGELVAVAVTIEPPEGVVVSDRDRRVVVSFLNQGG